MQLHPKQQEVVRSPYRFKVVRAGRKGGKTAMEVENIGYKAIAKASILGIAKTEFPTGRKVIYIAPTQTQARNIIWQALKNRFHDVGVPNEQMLQMKLPNADGGFSTIYVGGWENRENYRGLTDVIHITFDEVDTLRDFFIAWVDIFRPMFLDTSGTANFIGTPKKENPNIRRLEKEAKEKEDWDTFHFTSADNPFLPKKELLQLKKEYEGNKNSYRQEILAEHIDDMGALFNYNALLDMFTNSVTKGESKYMTVDVAGEGADKTILTCWHGLEAYSVDIYDGLRTDGIINQIRETASAQRIPYSNIAIDAIGEGAGVASSPLLSGVIGYKSSYQPIMNEKSIVRLPNVHYTKDASLVSEFRNLRSQCIFKLSELVMAHTIAIHVEDVRIRSMIIDELATYQDVSKGDGKRFATPKEEVKELIGRSPDVSDTIIMRMYFVLREGLSTMTGEQELRVTRELTAQFDRNFTRMKDSGTQ